MRCKIHSQYLTKEIRNIKICVHCNKEFDEATMTSDSDVALNAVTEYKSLDV